MDTGVGTYFSFWPYFISTGKCHDDCFPVACFLRLLIFIIRRVRIYPPRRAIFKLLGLKGVMFRNNTAVSSFLNRILFVAGIKRFTRDATFGIMCAMMVAELSRFRIAVIGDR